MHDGRRADVAANLLFASLLKTTSSRGTKSVDNGRTADEGITKIEAH
jgi:hypothetical protein